MSVVDKEPVVAAEDEVLPCPGCKRDVAYSSKEGWVDVFGFKKCEPRTTSHGDHIDLILVKEDMHDDRGEDS